MHDESLALWPTSEPNFAVWKIVENLISFEVFMSYLLAYGATW